MSFSMLGPSRCGLPRRERASSPRSGAACLGGTRRAGGAKEARRRARRARLGARAERPGTRAERARQSTTRLHVQGRHRAFERDRAGLPAADRLAPGGRTTLGVLTFVHAVAVPVVAGAPIARR